MKRRVISPTLSSMLYALCSVSPLPFALSVAGALLFAHNLPAQAQQAKKVYRIGVLQRSTLPASFLEAFRRGLRELGYVEGQNIVIENR
ncbi:MAG: hypothetical protein ACREQ2_25035, partial [Candidatus Binatia bacterium]